MIITFLGGGLHLHKILLSISILDSKSQFKLVLFALESLIEIMNSGFEVAHGLEEDGKNSSLFGHLNKLHDAHLRKILKSKFGQPSMDLKCWLRVK